ncbi:MAG: NAD-dependent epimerase/dehydratase family protein [Myxococcaceae bacterium]|nr:NAD-dependent epimerase/dehydratase family protein [Myxococcaceae bacterium]MBH2006137.1 NAD-dependent epimerase/dehydratase family protein [Myxococcaceae bacterium]
MILITGAAGFVGASLSRRFLREGQCVLGLDNLNDYYDPALKKARLDWLKHPNFRFIKLDLANRDAMEKLFCNHSFDQVIHLAAQAGVRHSVTHPHVYIDSNVTGFLHILEGCRNATIPLIYASTSSVYGKSTRLPFSEDDPCEHPITLYGATKRANELMAYSYTHLYTFPTTGLRFFTVYGPWGRPDMALFKFTANILKGEPIEVYNHGDMLRNFTYVDDIVEGIFRLSQKKARGAEIYNLGNPLSTPLMDYVQEIEVQTGKKAILNFMPMQPGDIAQNPADTRKLQLAIGFTPQVRIQEGIQHFVAWYRDYYGLRTCSAKKSATRSKSKGQG